MRPDHPIRHIEVDWADDFYPPLPDEKMLGRIRIRRSREPIWPEEFEDDDALREAELEAEREEIAALSDELRALREDYGD